MILDHYELGQTGAGPLTVPTSQTSHWMGVYLSALESIIMCCIRISNRYVHTSSSGYKAIGWFDLVIFLSSKD